MTCRPGPSTGRTSADKGNYLVFIVYYHPAMKLTARGEALRKKYREQFKEDPVYGALNGYAQVILLADALNAAKSDKGEDLVKALLANRFEGWNATISFARGEGPYWQQWTPPMLFMQYTKVGACRSRMRRLFSQPEFKTGDLVWPEG